MSSRSTSAAKSSSITAQSRNSAKAQRPKPPSALTPGTQSSRVVCALALSLSSANALHFEHEIERLVAAIVEPDQEVGQVAPRDAAIEIGNLEAQRLVLGVGQHARMVFERQRELLLPAAVEHDMADVALGRLRAGLPAGLRGDEVDVARRSLGVVGIEHRHDAPLAAARAGDVDLLRRAGELVLIEDRADRHALRDQIAFVEPAARETLNLRKQMLLGKAVLVAEAACRADAWRG